ncbi:uncharacterized protein LOC143595150 [Bidens hawaiensis]|uniref:uncharacterized protein LOC143595150 n=1 Tax=Bidens hawaiensis TaxID=980011 RepID=UPI004049A9B3
MSTLKKKLLPTTTAFTVGCGSSCRRINLSKIFNPKPYKHKHKHHHHCNPSSTSTSTSWTTTTTATLSLTNSDTTVRAVQGFGWLGGNSMAVEKDSSDPYVDFRDSMMQMIMEKEIYGEDDLQELLNCFLQLNSPYYHGIIIKAFTEFWSNVSN